MIRTQAQRSPIGLVALVLGLALALHLAYQLSIGIPARVLIAQEATAQALLLRLAPRLSSESAKREPSAAEQILAPEGTQPYILALGQLDRPHTERPAGAASEADSRPTPPGASLAIPPELIGAAVASPNHAHVATLTAPRRLLGVMSTGRAGPPSSPDKDPATSPEGPLLYLVLDLAAAEHAERLRLLSWAGVLPWALSVLLALGLAVLLKRYPGASSRTASEPNARDADPLADSGSDPVDGRIDNLDPILDIAAVLLVGMDPEGRVQLVNRKCCEVLGLDREQIVGRDWADSFVPEREREQTRKILARITNDDDALVAVEGTLLCADGSERLIEWNNSRIRDRAGRVIGGLGSGTDITERKQAERALSYLVTLETVLVETSRSLVAAPADAVGPLVENALGTIARRMGAERAYVFVLSRDGATMRNTQEWTASGLGLAGAGAPPVPTSLIPRWMETLQHGDDIRIDDVTKLPETWRVDREQLEQLEVRSVAAVAIRVAGRIGGFVAMEMLSDTRSWRDSEMRALGFLGDLIGGAFERRRNEQKLLDSRRRLEEIALYDPLTRLPNRRLLAERMDEAVVRAREQGLLLGVCYLDLDGFKPINDTHGHKMGDRVLVTVASRLRGCVREDDTVARLGGDEFVLLMNHMESLSDCAALLERVLAALAQPILIDGHSLAVTGSAGVTLFPRDAGDADTLLRHADHAMYQAKQQGRNRFQFFKAVKDQPDQAHKLELVRIREAIEGHELRLHVQPRVDMRSGQVVGVEALVRWQHPERGLLPPGEFLPLMEGDELLHDLDWWVMDRALALLVQWQDAGLDLTMSLNLSACSLQDTGFVAALQEVLARYPSIDPARLLFEIVESEALRDIETTASVIRACAVLGVHFALDGFGNGYASLTDFRCLPAQVVKIDQTVVRDILRSRDGRSLVKGVIGIANAFQREVIAEGVESAAHGLLLMDLGCTLAQGYGIADPMPPERLASWIEGFRPPQLWSDRPAVDWSSEDLALLGLEAVHRDWVNRLVRHISTDTATRAPELRPELCDFGRWYLGSGQARYGEMPSFRALDALHRQVHRQAEQLLALDRLDREALNDPIAQLLQERDGMVDGIRLLQAEVLGRTQEDRIL
ncbi:MAG: EAL domain-containing protein [Thiocapsa sp.]|uniref:EAL domain-containing protein n=1 Tax=Thiocapsa sp. TaxID=2024551 RepID=UPI001BCF186B|nr:EAL domain-containing protein [Thiocapsa sp.]QVL51124.1 MAG: EAL domain-containing protein [Thiocapsa sp.]